MVAGCGTSSCSSARRFGCRGVPGKARAGYSAARRSEVGDEPVCNGTAAADEHDGYGRGGSPGRAHGGILANDRGPLPVYQISRECREPIELILRPAEFDRHVMAVDEPGFLQLSSTR